MNSNICAAIICAGILAAVNSPAGAQVATTYTIPVQIRVVDAHGKPIPNVLLRGCDTRITQTCDMVVSQVYANREGFAEIRIPVPAWPNAFRVEVADSMRSDIVVLYRTMRGCEFRYTQQYTARAISCGNRVRSTTSAFQPAALTDTYNLGQSQIRTLLGKRP
jgi:hypothetical protein